MSRRAVQVASIRGQHPLSACIGITAAGRRHKARPCNLQLGPTASSPLTPMRACPAGQGTSRAMRHAQAGPEEASSAGQAPASSRTPQQARVGQQGRQKSTPPLYRVMPWEEGRTKPTSGATHTGTAAPGTPHRTNAMRITQLGPPRSTPTCKQGLPGRIVGRKQHSHGGAKLGCSLQGSRGMQ